MKLNELKMNKMESMTKKVAIVRGSFVIDLTASKIGAVK